MEGPGVHHVADKLSLLEGQEIKNASGNADQPLSNLVGQQITTVRAVKKRLFIDCSTDHVIIHFLMYGTYRIDEYRDTKERLSLECQENTLNIYSCSVKVLPPGSSELAAYDRPEEDVLSESYDPDQALAAIKKSEAPVVDLLLDQEVFGGVGNRLKSEILWELGIPPNTKASAVSETTARKLIEEAVSWAERWYSAKHNEKTVGFQIYRGGTCPNCETDLAKDEIGTNERLTYWCPKCQSE